MWEIEGGRENGGCGGCLCTPLVEIMPHASCSTCKRIHVQTNALWCTHYKAA